MARAAYLMDKLMVRIGLSGKSFIPLLSSFACAIPGVMAARVIENRRDRLLTILIAPLMSCSARLPVYLLLIAAFIPPTYWLGGTVGQQGVTMFAMYLVGIVTAVVVAWVFGRTILKGETPPFVMELPNYKLPSPQTVLLRLWDRGLAFLSRAGTLILAVAIVVWAAAYYPRNAEEVETPYAAERDALQTQISAAEETGASTEPLREQLREVDNQVAGAHLRQSYLGRAGHWIEPVVRPLGWDWKIGCAAIASFPAREIVVGTLGVLYNLGEDADEESESLRQQLRDARRETTGEPVYNVPVALSIMVFFALCAQCFATLAVIRRETGSWRWPVFTFVYMTTLAYLAALATYQIGMWVSA
jgi:ferrous iron transport protein B